MAIGSAQVQQSNKPGPMDYVKYAADGMRQAAQLIQLKRQIDIEQDKARMDRSKLKLEQLSGFYKDLANELQSPQLALKKIGPLMAAEFKELGMSDAAIESLLSMDVIFTPEMFDTLVFDEFAKNGNLGGVTPKVVKEAKEAAVQPVQPPAQGSPPPTQGSQPPAAVQPAYPQVPMETPGVSSKGGWDEHHNWVGPMEGKGGGYVSSAKPEVDPEQKKLQEMEERFAAIDAKIAKLREQQAMRVETHRWVGPMEGRGGGYTGEKSTIDAEIKKLEAEKAALSSAHMQQLIKVGKSAPLVPAAPMETPTEKAPFVAVKSAQIAKMGVAPEAATPLAKQLAEMPMATEPTSATELYAKGGGVAPEEFWDEQLAEAWYGRAARRTPDMPDVAWKAGKSFLGWLHGGHSAFEETNKVLKYTRKDAQILNENVKRYVEISNRTTPVMSRERLAEYATMVGNGNANEGLRRISEMHRTELINAETNAKLAQAQTEKVFRIPRVTDPEAAAMYRMVGVEPGQELNLLQMQVVLGNFTNLMLGQLQAAIKDGAAGNILVEMLKMGADHVKAVTEKVTAQKLNAAQFESAMGGLYDSDPYYKGAIDMFNRVAQMMPEFEGLFTGTKRSVVNFGLLGNLIRGIGQAFGISSPVLGAPTLQQGALVAPVDPAVKAVTDKHLGGGKP